MSQPQETPPVLDSLERSLLPERGGALGLGLGGAADLPGFLGQVLVLLLVGAVQALGELRQPGALLGDPLGQRRLAGAAGRRVDVFAGLAAQVVGLAAQFGGLLPQALDLFGPLGDPPGLPTVPSNCPLWLRHEVSLSIDRR